MTYKRSILTDEQEGSGFAQPAIRRDQRRPIIRSLHKPGVEPHTEEASVLERRPQQDQPTNPIYFVKDTRGLVRIAPEEIQFLRADGNYVELHLLNRRVVLRNSLAEVIKMLPTDLMCQVNRSQAVNIHHLDLIGPDEVRIGDHAFTLSKHYREPLLSSVQIIAGR